MSTELTDESDYRFRLDAMMQLGAATADISQAPPGFTIVSLPSSGSATIANETPGRDADVSSLSTIELIGIWPASSPICADLGGTVFGSSGQSATATPLSCSVRLGDGLLPMGTTTIPAGGTMTTDLSAGGAISPGAVQNQIAESFAVKLIAALKVPPTAIGLVTGPDDHITGPTRTNCTYSDGDGTLVWLSNNSAAAQAFCKSGL